MQHLHEPSLVSDLLDVSYVDELTGSNHTTCGINRTTACKDLSEGVRKTKEFGAVYIIGNHHLHNFVVLNRSITIMSENTEEDWQLTMGSHNVAFKLKCGIEVGLKQLYFVNMSVIDAHHCINNKPDVLLDRITVVNTIGGQRIVRIGRKHGGDTSGSLIIRSSLFGDRLSDLKGPPLTSVGSPIGFELNGVKNIYINDVTFTSSVRFYVTSSK